LNSYKKFLSNKTFSSKDPIRLNQPDEDLRFRLSAGARAFEVEGPNLKVRGPKFFIDFSPRKACLA